MTQTKPRYIYSLSDPESGDVKYVGATVNPMKRLSVHCSPSARKGVELGHWLSGLLNRGVRPVLCVLERVDGPEWGERETWWIQRYRERGHELLNRNAGGDGPPLLEDGRWSRDYDACIDCGRTDRIHAGDGRCIACYNRRRHRATMQPDRPYFEWSLDYERCVECGTTERAHKGHGLCTNCFANRRYRARRAAIVDSGSD